MKEKFGLIIFSIGYFLMLGSANAGLLWTGLLGVLIMGTGAVIINNLKVDDKDD